MRIVQYIAAGAVALLLSSTAFAHVTLEVKEAPADSYYKAAFNVGHGCDGSPTVKIRVQIPDGVTNVKPQPKPAWELVTVKGKLAKPIKDSHGNEVTEGIREVAWTGKLLDEHFDQFVMQVKLPNTPDVTVYFPTLQECEKGVLRWIEIPAAGKTRRDYKEPPPEVKLTPKL